jgi:hypothetical protein
LIAILSLLVYGGLSGTALAAGSAPVTVFNTATNPVPITGTITGSVAIADSPAHNAVQWDGLIVFTNGVGIAPTWRFRQARCHVVRN